MWCYLGKTNKRCNIDIDGIISCLFVPLLGILLGYNLIALVYHVPSSCPLNKRMFKVH